MEIAERCLIQLDKPIAAAVRKKNIA